MKPSFSEFVRTATRPVLTIIGLLAWVMFIEAGVPYPSEFQWLVVGMAASWFGERALARVQGRQP